MVKRKVENMTLEQKIGHLLCIRNVKTEEDKKFLFEMLEKGAVGGIQIRYEKGCEDFIKEIKKRAGYPVLICADMEHGYPGSEYVVPAQMSVSSTGKTEYAYNLAKAVAIEAKAAGYNVVWGPVVDFAGDGKICSNPRCFSDETDVVSEYACAMIKGYQEQGMIATAKHFPGGSDTYDDTHIKEAHSMLTVEDLKKKDLIPYVEAIKKADVSAVMTNHKVYENIDPEYIGTLSEKIISILRELGFDGLVFTDSLGMMSVAKNYGIEKSMGYAIKAGHDMVLYNQRISFKQAFDYMMDEYKKGTFGDERLNDAVRHVLEAQEKTLKEAESDKLNDEQVEFLYEISKLSLCAKLKEGVTAKLDPDTKKGFILLCENKYDFQDDTYELQAIDQYSRISVEKKKQEIEKEFPGAKVIIMSEFPHKKEMQDACLLLAEADETIFFTFNITTNHLGNNDITDRIKYLIKCNEDRISTVVHIGNPYVVKNFSNIKRVLWGTVGGECDSWAIKALKGDYEPTGKIPVKI